MARKTTIVLEDDLTGGLLAEGDGGTVSFSLDGQTYEIDLSAENSAQLRADFQRYVDAARRITSPRGSASAGRSTGGGRAAADRKESGEIREWARQNGHEVSERGRIPAGVIEAYRAAR